MSGLVGTPSQQTQKQRSHIATPLSFQSLFFPSFLYILTPLELESLLFETLHTRIATHSFGMRSVGLVGEGGNTRQMHGGKKKN